MSRRRCLSSADKPSWNGSRWRPYRRVRLYWPTSGVGRVDAVTVVVPDDVIGFVSLELVSFVSTAFLFPLI